MEGAASAPIAVGRKPGTGDVKPPNHVESIFVLLCTPFTVGSGFGLHGMKQVEQYWNLRSRAANDTL
eukprot:scaffold48078_cov13-Tisochrysis_lutea.AAC.1